MKTKLKPKKYDVHISDNVEQYLTVALILGHYCGHAAVYLDYKNYTLQIHAFSC